MSKASRYADAAHHAAELEPEAFRIDDSLVGECSPDGELLIYSAYPRRLSTEEALALAGWLLDVFGEEQRTEMPMNCPWCGTPIDGKVSK